MRYGAQFGPDITFLGVDKADLDEPDTYADADVVILGAPAGDVLFGPRRLTTIPGNAGGRAAGPAGSGRR